MIQIEISVVIAARRKPELLKRCLNALNRQTLDKSRFEVIVVSDGPEKTIRDLVLSYKSYAFRYYCTERPQGVSAALNLGWQASSGTLIAFTDPGAIPDPGWLQSFLEYPKASLITALSGMIRVPLPAHPTDHQRSIASLEGAEFSLFNSALSRTALEVVHGLDERYHSLLQAGNDLALKLLSQNIPVLQLDEARVVYPARETDWRISIREQKKNMYDALLYKKFPLLYRQRIQARPRWDYYLMIISLAGGIAAAVTGSIWLAVAGFLVYFILVSNLVASRLLFSSRKKNHVFGVVISSFLIPFVASFWLLYGDLKYRASLF